MYRRGCRFAVSRSALASYTRDVRGFLVFFLGPLGLLGLLGIAAAACTEVPFADDFAVEGLDAGQPDLTPQSRELGPPDLAAPPPQIVYVSGYSPQIARFLFNPATGGLSSLGTTPVSGNPSFLAVDPARRHLYALDESTPGLVRAFTIDGMTGALTPLGATVASGGNGPAHLSVDPSGKWLLVANYGDGKVAVITLLGDGSLGLESDNKTPGMNAHEILADEPGTHVFVPCKGSDYTAQYLFDAVAGKLVPNGPATAAASMVGAGPRHMAMRPGFAWIIEENTSTMAAYTRDTNGRLVFLHALPTVPAGTMNNTAAEVVLSGTHLYGSNRGHDSIVQFDVAADGHISTVGYTKTGGKTPRSFTVDSSGKWLLVANQDTNEVRVLSLDPLTGVPTLTTTMVTAPSPAFVGIVTLPGT
jgi:6-phosphogluconolactonase